MLNFHCLTHCALGCSTFLPAFWINFYFSCEDGEFFGVKRVAPSSTLKMRKSKKKLARVLHTRVYAIT